MGKEGDKGRRGSNFEGCSNFLVIPQAADIIHVYEEQHHDMPAAEGVEVLQYLMAEHGLRQADLPEIGSQGMVSEILRGKRSLNTRQIKGLAERLGV